MFACVAGVVNSLYRCRTVQVYWFMGLPLAILLALRYHQGARGLWLAMGTASGLQVW